MLSFPLSDAQAAEARLLEAEDARAEARFKAGQRVCPQPPCATCGHYLCHSVDSEDPSDLGGWQSLCCSLSCPCAYCEYCRATYRNRLDVFEHIGCCKCYRRERERR